MAKPIVIDTLLFTCLLVLAQSIRIWLGCIMLSRAIVDTIGMSFLYCLIKLVLLRFL